MHRGIGFALIQYGDKGKPKIITCGSKSLTDTQRRYATIELDAWQSGGPLISVTFISEDCLTFKSLQITDRWREFFLRRFMTFQTLACRDIENALRLILLQ